MVIVKVVHYPEEPTLTSSFVRKVDVGCLTCHVLRGGCASYGIVESRTTIARADGNRAIEVFTERFENVDAELLEIADNFE